MSWHYSHKDQRLGPVSEEELLRLVGEGTVTPMTPVWKDGMADWQLWGSVATAMFPDSILCQACNRPFPKDDLVTIQGVMICAACKPAQLQRVREGLLPLGGGGLTPTFGSGKRMIIALNSPLPNRCVCCNGPASDGKRRTFYWYPPWIYGVMILLSPLMFMTPLVLLSPLILILVRMVIGKTVRLDIPLCAEHLAKRRKRLWIGWAWGLSSLLGMVLAVVLMNNNQGEIGGFLILASFISVVAALIVGQRTASILSVHKIGKETATFGRVSPEFIGSLPPWPGGPAL